MDIELREFKPEQLEAVAKLLRLSWYRDSLPDFLVREKILGERDYAPALTLLAFSGEELAGFSQGVVKDRPNGRVGYIKLFCVHPLYQRHGIGRKLIAELENNLAAHGAESIRLFESYPNYLCPGVDPFYTSAISFFERSGYEKIGDTSNLVTSLLDKAFDTTAEEKHLSELGIICRRAEAKDYTDIRDWICRHFAAWEGEVESAFTNNPISVFIAVKGAAVIGFSAFEGNNKGTGCFGPMGTQTDCRGSGVGAVLLKQCLRSMKQTGFVKAIIPWVGPIPFYKNAVGADVDRVFWRYEKKL